MEKATVIISRYLTKWERGVIMKEDASREVQRNLRRVQYEGSDQNGRLIINFRDINHIMRSLYEGKGSQKRILIVLLETGKITQRVLTGNDSLYGNPLPGHFSYRLYVQRQISGNSSAS